MLCTIVINFFPELEELWQIVEKCDAENGSDVTPRGPLVAHVVKRLIRMRKMELTSVNSKKYGVAFTKILRAPSFTETTSTSYVRVVDFGEYQMKRWRS